MTGNALNRPPVEVGEVIATGWNLYRRNFSQYALVALKAYLWLFVPTVIVTVASSLSAPIAGLPDQYAGLGLLLFVAFMVGYVVCAARYFGWITGISRLAYQVLRGAVDEREALRFTRSRQYSLLWENLLKVLIFLIPGLVWLITIGIIVAGSGLTPEMLAQPERIDLAIVGRIILISLPVSLIFIVFIAWLGLRTMLADQALAVEPESGAIASIGRSWKLVKGSVLRSFFVAFVAYLFIVPVSVFLSIFGQALGASIFAIAPPEEVVINSFGDALPYIGIAVISTIFSTLAGVVTMPLWQTMATTLYVRLVEKLTGEKLATAGGSERAMADS